MSSWPIVLPSVVLVRSQLSQLPFELLLLLLLLIKTLMTMCLIATHIPPTPSPNTPPSPFIRLTFAARRAMTYFYLHRHLACSAPRKDPSFLDSSSLWLQPALPSTLSKWTNSCHLCPTVKWVGRGSKFLLPQCSKLWHKTLEYPFKMPIKDGESLQIGGKYLAEQMCIQIER